MTVAALAVVTPGARAATWTEVPSATTEDITAIEYQGAARFWFTTGSGKIFRRVAGVFVQEGSFPTTAFRDIEFQDGGEIGIAAGTNGVVVRSIDGGDTWAASAVPPGGSANSSNDCATTQALGTVDSVRFAGNARAWLVAGGSQIFRTPDAATAANVGASNSWVFINNNAGTCRIPKDIDDLFPVSSTSAFFVSKDFGTVYFTSNALTSAASTTAADAGGGFQGTRHIAGDPTNANRQWVVGSEGPSGSFGRTSDGWATNAAWSIVNPERGTLSPAQGIDFNGGTVTAVGDGGLILESVDGSNFYHDPAGAGLTTRNWRAVSHASAADAAIGGDGGKLVVSENANVVPDIVAPTGTIGGPSNATAGQATAFTAIVADNAGGSGVDPAGYRWSVPGLPSQAGGAVSYTFPAAGLYFVTLSFRDRAGNAGSATKLITVGAAARARFTFPPSSKPPVVGGAARKRGKYVVIKVSGSLKRPSGISAAAACRGKIALTVSKAKGKKRTLKKASTKLTSRCKYRRTLRVRRSRVGKLKSLKLKVAFKGNAVIGASSFTYTVPVK